MYLLDADSLEVAQVIHSFFEWIALIFFAGVVACDVLLQCTERNKGLKWPINWSRREFDRSLFGRTLRLAIPAYSGVVNVKAVLKINSLLWFGMAILLEIVSLRYSETVDRFANEELADSRKLMNFAIRKASEANALAKQYESQIESAKALAKQAEEKTAAVQAVVMPNDLTPEDMRNIGDACKKLSGRKVFVSRNTSDIEGRVLAGLIITALKSGQVNVVHSPDSGISYAGTASGLTLSGKDTAVVETLRHALEDIGKLRVKVEDVTATSPTVPIISAGVFPFKKSQE